MRKGNNPWESASYFSAANSKTPNYEYRLNWTVEEMGWTLEFTVVEGKVFEEVVRNLDV